MKKIIIIDGNSIINRAYFAMQRPMITKKGVYTQGIYGFINMLLKIMEDHSPTHMAVAWDMKSPTFRHKEYDGYKAGRKSMPLELAMEMPIMKEILKAMTISNLEINGYEADDIIGTVAKRAEIEDVEALIITGDKDALQLATEKTKVLITKKGITDYSLYDKQAMIDEYSLTPEQFIDLKGLMGDKSDNIPGIPGVGQVTGIKLLNQFGSMENLLANSEEIENVKLREKVQSYEMQAAMSKKLATIFTDVPIDFEIDDFKLKEYDTERLSQLFTELEFKNFIKRFNLNTKEAIVLEAKKVFPGDFHSALSELKKLNSGKEIYIKVTSDGNHVMPVFIDSIAIFDGKNCYYFDQGLLMGELFKLLNNKNFIYRGFDVKEALYALKSNGVDNFSVAGDIALAEYVLNPSRSKYDLADIASERIGFEYKADKFLTKEGQGMYFAVIEAVEKSQIAAMKSDDLLSVYEEIEVPLIKVLANMEASGVKTEAAVLQELGSKNQIEIDRLVKEIYQLAGEEFNINSPKQLGLVLFENMKLPHGKKNKNGYSTSVDVLEKLRPDYPIIEKILEYRSLTKLNSTYVSGLLALIGQDGRIRPHFMQTVAATGRISCVEPNLQNIPIKTEIGREIRKAFVASSEEKVLVSADYSQIELRVLAHLSADEHLIKAFNDGDDIHRLTASKVFDLDMDQVTPIDRSRAKAINFGVIYGMSGFGLSEELGISIKSAEAYINDYFAKYNKVKAFMDNEIANCKENGYTRTLFGRKRYVPELNASNFMTRQAGERLAMNTPIQGTAADIIKIAMIKVFDRLEKELPEAKLLLQIHDELIIEGDKKNLDKLVDILKSSMEEAVKLSVKLESNVSTGNCWFDLK